MTVLLLPMPPTSNNLFPSGKSGKRFISPEYKAWRQEAGYSLNAQRPDQHAGNVEVRYELGRYGDKRRRDIANREKALGDLLVDQRVIRDDSMIQRLVMEWSAAVPEGRVRATITDWEE